jgi:hypothetical protein
LTICPLSRRVSLLDSPRRPYHNESWVGDLAVMVDLEFSIGRSNHSYLSVHHVHMSSQRVGHSRGLGIYTAPCLDCDQVHQREWREAWSKTHAVP